MTITFYKRNSLVAIMVLCFTTLQAQYKVSMQKQRAFPNTVTAGNYSGIAYIGNDQYAVANDKSTSAGFHIIELRIDSVTGKLKHAKEVAFKTSGKPNRDEEGIAYMPTTNTIFISGEIDNDVLEYDMEGTPTGRKLQMPEMFKTVKKNRGLEALTYNAQTHRFWTTSENPLPQDGQRATLRRIVRNKLRLQSFDDSLRAREQFFYEMDEPVTRKQKGKLAIGLSGMAAMDDGKVIMLEREIYVHPKQLGSYVNIKLFLIDPTQYKDGDMLPKKLLVQFRTKMSVFKHNLANYEGICLGPRLKDGSQTIVLMCDSQNQYMGLLKDWFKVITIKKEN